MFLLHSIKCEQVLGVPSLQEKSPKKFQKGLFFEVA